MRLLLVVCAALGVACSRVPEEPNPVVKEMRPLPGPTSVTTGPVQPQTKVLCPPDPDPSQIGKLYGHGEATFVTPDGAKHAFDVEIAKTDEAQQRGLMYRTSLDEKKGMVFVFEKPHQASFWMHNTCIALDMVFVSEDDKVIGVVTAPPLTDDARMVPGISKYVVELAAGVAKKKGIAIGTVFVPPK